MEKAKSKKIYIVMLLSVVFIWGSIPSLAKWLLGYYSPVVKSAASSFIAFVAMLIICASTGKLKKLDWHYFAVAVPTGLFYSGACIMQSIGLTMITPALYSFLENLSCLVVPVLVWVMTKKRPPMYKFIGAVLCLISVYILSSADGFASFKFGTGEVLCGLAGMFYGVNIAVTGIKAKNLETPLYLLIQFGVHMIASTVFTLVYEQPKFAFSPLPLFALVASVLISTVLGWMIRTVCLTHLDPTLVTVIMPFSSVVTTVISVIAGFDRLSLGLVIGALVGIAAVIVCDVQKREKKMTAETNGEIQ